MTATGPVFVVGSPRSGTSILTWCLGQHPNLLPLPESNWMGQLAQALDTCHHVGSCRGERSQLSSMGISRDDLYECIGGAIDGLILGRRAALEARHRDRALRDLTEASPRFTVSRAADEPKRRWVDGTPEYSFYIFGLKRLFPDARFIHLLRDVGSVVNSMLNFSRTGGGELVSSEEAAYTYWLRTVRACVEAEQALGSRTVLRVRFSDLVGSPAPTLRRCLEFLGEPFSPACLEPLESQINSSRVPPDYDPTDSQTDPSVRETAHRLSQKLLSEPDRAVDGDRTSAALGDRAFSRRSRHLARAGGELDAALRKLAVVERELSQYRPATVVERLREAVRAKTPYDAILSVISRGDQEMLDLSGREAWHFPGDALGRYTGYHPADCTEAIELLEGQRARGSEYLLIPWAERWWLEHYSGLTARLEVEGRKIHDAEDSCIIYTLDRRNVGPEGRGRADP